MTKRQRKRIEAVTETILDERASRWVLRKPDGKLWTTCCAYTRDQIEAFCGRRFRAGLMHSTPVRRSKARFSEHDLSVIWTPRRG